MTLGCYQHAEPQWWCEACKTYAEIDRRHLWTPESQCVLCNVVKLRGQRCIKKCHGPERIVAKSTGRTQ